jgi:hypothetical protein
MGRTVIPKRIAMLPSSARAKCPAEARNRVMSDTMDMAVTELVAGAIAAKSNKQVVKSSWENREMPVFIRGKGESRLIWSTGA